ncbi:SDR family oxidoreductase [Enterovibrio nigricans]|uniref:Short-chain dehydrogenase n=1 Tax=Enterovibrio nigricans DSM 22720 TaxID=1121868 RepID=A0A1T4U4G7_9GAMM|nr:SDR family oxidoreductase [Enterovibrio nigricans]PKF51858.1 short-chain dehydrogenase [Enterovibrio nigricans]SKA47428.1 Short-chain dehydrogenase [Enterovibrio nigricans DSM 22720]
MTKSVLITGCSTGIGYACAHALVKNGFNVIASCRKQEDVKRLKEEGLNCIQLDLADTDSILSAVKKVAKQTDGKLFALFNNGAYGQPGALEDLPTQALRTQFETNVFGWHTLTQAVIPMMMQNGSGRIVQNSSVLGFVALKYRGAYNASKFAIEGYTDTLRLELEDTPIQVSLIEPGPIESRFRANALTAFFKAINLHDSRHEASYLKQKQRLESETSGSKYTLPSEAIVEPLLHALTAPKAKIRYRVTKPTQYMAICKRVLSSRMLDKMLSEGS